MSTAHHMTRAIVRRSICLVLGAVCCVLSGCIHRSLTVLTEPPGAKVYINDELKGDTPVSYDFTWYGWYRLTLRKDGFDRVDDHRFVKAPMYCWIPFDLVMELVPLTIRDARTWSYTLTKSAELPTPVPPSLDEARDGALSRVEGTPQTLSPEQEPVAAAPAAETPAATPSPDDAAPTAAPAATRPEANTPANESSTANTEMPDGTR